MGKFSKFSALIAVVFILPVIAFAAVPGRVTVNGTQFNVCGQNIWMCGANTPWDNWNDFGGTYTPSFWDTHYAQFNPNGLNASRVWITCSGEVGINIDSTGYVSGATAAHWADLDDFFAKAQSHGVYIMATLMSFDHFKNTYTTYQSWRNWINSDANIDSYITNYLIPFVTRYGSNTALWCIDMTNEPEWASDTEGGAIAWPRFQEFWAKAAKAIHNNSPVLVTVGMGVIKYNSDNAGMNGNKVSDAALQAQLNDPAAKLDFYSPHWYSWMDPYWTALMYATPLSFGISAKPCVVGECSANGSTGHTLIQDYEAALANGWRGMQPWSSNGVDTNGGWAQVQPAALSFMNNHPGISFPVCSANSPTFTQTRTATRTFTSTPTRTSTPLAPTATFTQTPSQTQTKSPTYTCTKTATPTYTLQITATYTFTLTATNTIQATSTFTSTKTNTPAATPSTTQTSTAVIFTPTNTATQSSTITVFSPTNTPVLPTDTITPSPAASRTQSFTPTAVSSATYTSTAVSTATRTYSVTPASTPTYTPTMANSGTQTFTPVLTATNTSTPVPTVTNTSTPFPTVTNTSTPFPTATNTATIMLTAVFTVTKTNTEVPTAAPTFTVTAVLGGDFEIQEIKTYTNPYSKGNMQISFCVTRPAKEIRVEIYTVSFRKIGEAVRTGYFEHVANVFLPESSLLRMGNGTYYMAIKAVSTEGKKAVSRLQNFLVIK
jgi:hypothetical protein